MITLEQLEYICPGTKQDRLALFVDPLNATFEEFGIEGADEQARFLAQVAHESGRFVYTREIWGPTEAQKRYEGRADLGNTQPGDGSKFRGRGLIQVTGRANYAACASALDLPLLDSPELLERPMPATRSAGWFWKSHGIGKITDFVKQTRAINGGINGLPDRQALLELAQVAVA